MLTKSRIIVLHTIKHSDSGMVVQCYSDVKGRSACYFFAGGKHSKSAMMFPLSMLDVVLFSRHQEGNTMPVIKEAVPVCQLPNLKRDIRKGAISIFMCELLLKTLKESSPDPSLFVFLSNSIMLLEAVDEGVENFHLHFAVNLCKVLGYMPEDNYSGPSFPPNPTVGQAGGSNPDSRTHFNFTTGKFTHDYSEAFCFQPEESLLLHQIMSTPLAALREITCSGQMRNRFLTRIIDYLSFHTSLRIELKSLAVLRELFS
ncbi:MAG: DNA repair protein RecO [Bacteroidales bacterium]|nr:DNA repair protein RecO [Bacteroidales bacterium]